MDMIKISTNELKRIIRHFNNKSMNIYINGIISGKSVIHKAKCIYTRRFDTLSIYDKLGDNRLTIEMSIVYKMQINKSKSVLEIKIDNEEEIRIEL